MKALAQAPGERVFTEEVGISSDTVHPIVEDVAKALSKDQGKDESLMLRSILGFSDGAVVVPNPRA